MCDWRSQLTEVVESVSASELPELIGELAKLKALARLRYERLNREPSSNGDRYLKKEQVAERLSVSPSWDWRHRDELGAVTLDGTLRFPEQALNDYLDTQTVRG